MRIMAGKAISILYRSVHNLGLPKSIVTLCAEHGHLGCQLKTLLTLQGVLLFFLLVTCRTIIIFYRTVWFQRAEIRLVA